MAMAEIAREILHVNLEDEMRQSYLDYAMSVIVGRALPDVRDGLKPVHRRILFGMQESNNVYSRPYVKCARVVGDVMGKYHPHGDSAIYDAMVRLAQPFSMRYLLVDGQGNFGSSTATRRRPALHRVPHDGAVLGPARDIDKETVDFVDNYDGKEKSRSSCRRACRTC
jgi:DNA gyrase subunit A